MIATAAHTVQNMKEPVIRSTRVRTNHGITISIITRNTSHAHAHFNPVIDYFSLKPVSNNNARVSLFSARWPRLRPFSDICISY